MFVATINWYYQRMVLMQKFKVYEIEFSLNPVPKLITKNKVSYPTSNTIYETLLMYGKTKFF